MRCGHILEPGPTASQGLRVTAAIYAEDIQSCGRRGGCAIEPDQLVRSRPESDRAALVYGDRLSVAQVEVLDRPYSCHRVGGRHAHRMAARTCHLNQAGVVVGGRIIGVSQAPGQGWPLGLRWSWCHRSRAGDVVASVLARHENEGGHFIFVNHGCWGQEGLGRRRGHDGDLVEARLVKSYVHMQTAGLGRWADADGALRRPAN